MPNVPTINPICTAVSKSARSPSVRSQSFANSAAALLPLNQSDVPNNWANTITATARVMGECPWGAKYPHSFQGRSEPPGLLRRSSTHKTAGASPAARSIPSEHHPIAEAVEQGAARVGADVISDKIQVL